MPKDVRGTPPPVASANAVILGVLSFVRVIQLASWPAAVSTGGTSGLDSPTLAWAVWAVFAGVTAVVVGSLWFLRRLSTIVGIADVCLAAVALLIGGVATRPGHGTDFNHPAVAMAIGTALTLAVFWPLRRTLPVCGALGAAYILGASQTIFLGPRALTSAASNLLQLMGLPIAVALLARHLDGLHQRLSSAEQKVNVTRKLLDAQDLRESERLRQYRTLHDTVLSTLSALSRGSLDTRDPHVQQRLAAEADYLRGLISTTNSTAGMQLVGELATLRREQAHMGLRIHPHIADVPDVLPAHVIVAVGLCMREALNNVVKHSGTREAWVTIVGPTDAEDPVLQVSVTDRGTGFDPTNTRPGVGLVQSIMARMTEADGVAILDSEPGQGTTVELRWPR